jgi:hypothetical protein
MADFKLEEAAFLAMLLLDVAALPTAFFEPLARVGKCLAAACEPKVRLICRVLAGSFGGALAAALACPLASGGFKFCCVTEAGRCFCGEHLQASGSSSTISAGVASAASCGHSTWPLKSKDPHGIALICLLKETQAQ